MGSQVSNCRGEVRKIRGGEPPIGGRERADYVSQGGQVVAENRILLVSGSSISGDSAAKGSDNSPSSVNMVMMSCGPSSNCVTRLHPFSRAHGNSVPPLASVRSGLTSFYSNSISAIPPRTPPAAH